MLHISLNFVKMNARAPGLYSLATVAALLAAAGLTGCGGGPAPAVEGPTPSAAPTSTPTVPAAQVDTPTEAEATEEAEEEEEKVLTIVYWQAPSLPGPYLAD